MSESKSDPPGPSDKDLVLASLAGHEQAVRTLVERYQQPVFRLCYRMLGQRQDAEDTTQEVFVRALRSLRRWDQQRPLRHWLLAIAANRCRTLLGWRARRSPPSGSLKHVPDRQAPLLFNELGEEMQLALEQLPENYRMVVLLFYEQECSCAEVAELLQRPEGTIKTWLHRARRLLAEHLRRRGVLPEPRKIAQ